MLRRIRNIKWQFSVYFLAATLATLVLVFAGYAYLAAQDTVPTLELMTGFIALILLIGTAIGYYFARQYQRKVDKLHLAIKQAIKGNWAERIEVTGDDVFDPLYRDFNALAASLEAKLKLLQQFGEADVLNRMQSNQDAAMEERKRLARDLHDTVSQQLFALHMSAAALPRLLETDPEAAKTVVTQLVTMSQHAQKQMRSLIAQLRPLELEEQTLSEALDKWFPDYCNQNGLQGKLDVQLDGELPEALEHQLFLIVQEGMANVVKHARAKNVSLALYDAGHQYMLKIGDDGVGFDMEGQKRTSYGLSTMAERAQRLGGDAEIVSRPGAGTTVHVRIPKFG